MNKLIYCFMVFVLVGCATGPVIIPPPIERASVKAEYLIGVGDQLNVSVWRNPELSVSAPVRPDGRISAPLVGDIMAQGETPEKLAKLVTDKLQQFVRNPEVTVIVVSPRSVEYADRIRVMGAVVAPRSMPHRDGMTIVDLVLEAGGLTEFAAPNKTLLYRADAEATIKAYPVYLDAILKKGDLETNFQLEPQDVIVVPERLF